MAENIAKLISSMESFDSKTSNDAILTFKGWIVEGFGITQLVEYYARCQSIRALELLCLVQEPHDKILLDSLSECMNQNPHGALILLGRIVQKATSWLPKFPHHLLFRQILESMQVGKPELVSAAALFITSILPYCSTMNEQLFDALFNAFIESCLLFVSLQSIRSCGSSLNKTGSGSADHDSFGRNTSSGDSTQRKPSPPAVGQLEKSILVEVQVDALKLSLMKFFHMLYALYPCNMMHYLRNFCQKNLPTLSSTCNVTSMRRLIEQLFFTVRLHPSFVFGYRANEFGRERWMAHEAHDFFAFATQISVFDMQANEENFFSASVPDASAIELCKAEGGVNAEENSRTYGSEDENFNNLPKRFMSSTSGAMAAGTSAGTENNIDLPASPSCSLNIYEAHLSHSEASHHGVNGASGTGGLIMSSGTDRPRIHYDNELSAGVVSLRDATDYEALSGGRGTAKVSLFRKVGQLFKQRTAMPVVHRSPTTRRNSFMSGDEPAFEGPTTNRLEAGATLVVEEIVGICVDGNEVPESSAEGIEAAVECIDELFETSHHQRNVRVYHQNESIVEEEDSLLEDNARSDCRQAVVVVEDGISGGVRPAEERRADGGDGWWRAEIEEGVEDRNGDSGSDECSRRRVTKQAGTASLSKFTAGKKKRKLSRTASLPYLKTVGIRVKTNGSSIASQCRAMNSNARFSTAAVAASTTPPPKTTYYCANCVRRALNTEFLLAQSERYRRQYVDASVMHHRKLKEMGLADRFPGRMYDDMSHILRDMPVERQNELLLVRLRLVNQHLLFERYCRLLHETRNRRLFGQLKQQRALEAECENLKKLKHQIVVELDEQIGLADGQRHALNEKCQQLAANEAEYCQQIDALLKKNATLQDELGSLRLKCDRLSEKHRRAEVRMSAALQANENLTAQLQLATDSLKEADMWRVEMSRLERELQAAEDELRMYKKEVPPRIAPSRQRAEEMVVPLYEAQLKSVRQYLRKTKMALNEALDRCRTFELQWKEELDRRLDLQATLERASLVHSKQVEAAQHKFNSLLAVCNKQEAHIFNLYRALENQAALLQDVNENKFSSALPPPLTVSKHNQCEMSKCEGGRDDGKDEKWGNRKRAKPIPIIGGSGDVENPSQQCEARPFINNFQASRTIPCDSPYVFSDLAVRTSIADLFMKNAPSSANNNDNITRVENDGNAKNTSHEHVAGGGTEASEDTRCRRRQSSASSNHSNTLPDDPKTFN